GDVGPMIRPAQHLCHCCDIRGTPDNGDDVTPVQLRIWQDWDGYRDRSARDLAQEYTACRRHSCQLLQRLSVDFLTGNINIDALDRDRQELAIVDFFRLLADESDE